jgi:hypothetical protein
MQIRALLFTKNLTPHSIRRASRAVKANRNGGSKELEYEFHLRRCGAICFNRHSVPERSTSIASDIGKDF